jgi:hypothetical protein
MKRSVLFLIAALAAFTLGIALAQVAEPPVPTIPGLDPAIVAGLIGIASAWLVKPLTALGKKWFGYEGITSQMVALALSVIIAGGVSYAQGAYSHDGRGIIALLIAVVTSFVKSMGDYTASKLAAGLPTGKANPLPTVSNEVASDPTIPLGNR